jgi:hypothetical protein
VQERYDEAVEAVGERKKLEEVGCGQMGKDGEEDLPVLELACLSVGNRGQTSFGREEIVVEAILLSLMSSCSGEGL